MVTLTASTARRHPSIDLQRGLAMVLMALDHTRDFFTNLSTEPESLAHTSYALFATRWVTHFCAPLFFFLAGLSAFFYAKDRPMAAVRRFLLSRGLWLILLEFTLVGTAWTFKFPWGVFGVIWALGASMVVLGALVGAKPYWIAILSVAVIALHDCLDTLRLPAGSMGAIVWGLLHVKGEVGILGVSEFVLFPLLPWCAVMSAGYAFGALFQRSDRTLWMRRLGTMMIVVFVFLRATNLYGNPPSLPGGVSPGDFHLQETIEKTIILFFDTEKYPPSLQFLLMTLGPSLLLFAWAEGKTLTGGLARPILAIGQVPLFFYVLHLYLIHSLAIIVAMAMHQPYAWLLNGSFWTNDRPAGYGYDLPVVYGMWVVVLTLIYFPCRWFAGTKQRRRDWWLSYL